MTTRTSWADLAANSAAENVGVGSSDSNKATGSTSGGGRPAYVPPHLRNRPPSADPPAPTSSGPASSNDRPGQGGLRWAAPRNDYNNRSRYGGSGCRPGGWGGRNGGWDRGRHREVNPFGNDDDIEQTFSEQEITAIDFDAYEDIPVDTSGDNVGVGSSDSNKATGSTSGGGRPAYVPPHLRNRPPSAVLEY